MQNFGSQEVEKFWLCQALQGNVDNLDYPLVPGQPWLLMVDNIWKILWKENVFICDSHFKI